MAQSIWYLHNDIMSPQDLHVTEGTVEVAYGLETSPSANVLATYSVDEDYDFGSITVSDTILDMHEQCLRTVPGVHKLTDGFYVKQSQYRAYKQASKELLGEDRTRQEAPKQ